MTMVPHGSWSGHTAIMQMTSTGLTPPWARLHCTRARPVTPSNTFVPRETCRVPRASRPTDRHSALAAALAFKGYHLDVAAFLTAVGRFWKDERLEDWTRALLAGEEPDGWCELVPDRDPDPDQQAAIDQLSPTDRDAIDSILLSFVGPQWRKIAMIVGQAMMKDDRVGVPDVYYASRVRALIQRGDLEVQGDPRYMRFSEVRLRS